MFLSKMWKNLINSQFEHLVVHSPKVKPVNVYKHMKDFKMPVLFHKVQLSVTRLNYEKCFYCKELYVSAVVT